MHGCNDIGLCGQISIGVVLLSLGVHILALASPSWVIGNTKGGTPVQDGIFYSCGYFRSAGSCATTNMDGAPDFFQAAFGFAVIALMLGALTALCVLLYYCADSIEEGSALGAFNIFGSLSAGASLLLAVLIFGSLRSSQFPSQYYELSWGFGLEAAAGILFLLAGSLLFVDYRST